MAFYRVTTHPAIAVRCPRLGELNLVNLAMVFLAPSGMTAAEAWSTGSSCNLVTKRGTYKWHGMTTHDEGQAIVSIQTQRSLNVTYRQKSAGGESEGIREVN